MKNKIILSLIILTTIFFGKYVFAEDLPPVVNINLKIVSSDNIIYDSGISVESCDSDNKPETANNTTPYCAIKQLEKLPTPINSDWTWYDFGAMLNSINDIAGFTSKDKDDNDVYHYWSWSLDSVEAMVGLNMYELKEGDTITLNFVPVEAKVVNEAPPVERHTSSGSMPVRVVSIPVVEKTFSVDSALEFLNKNQNKDGSFNSPMYTDWVAVGVGSSSDNKTKENLINYLKINKIESNIITDYERRAMALMALGINPYSGTEVNYIKKIVDSFDGIQIGDKDLINDDVFALIVLENAGYDTKDEIITKDVNYLISKQETSGSFGSIDMTAAALEALKGFEEIAGVKDSITKIESYLISKQENDFSFGNSFSTIWVLQNLFNNSNVLKAEKYLALKQGTDGGMGESTSSIDSRVWETAYAVPAILHKPWGEILNKFPKEEIKSLPSPNVSIKNNEEKINKKEVLKSLKTNTNIIENSQNDNPEINTEIDIKNNKENSFWGHIKKPFVWLWSKF